MCGLFRGPGLHPVEPKRHFETKLLFLTKTWSSGVGTLTNLLSKTLLLTYRKCAWERGLFLTLWVRVQSLAGASCGSAIH